MIFFVLLDKIMQELFPLSLKTSPYYFCINSDEKNCNFLNRGNKKFFLIEYKKLSKAIFWFWIMILLIGSLFLFKFLIINHENTSLYIFSNQTLYIIVTKDRMSSPNTSLVICTYCGFWIVLLKEINHIIWSDFGLVLNCIFILF